MSVVIIDTLSRGSTGESPFPVILEQDAKISYLTVLDDTERDAIPEWKRSANMRVHVVTPDAKDYRLGTNVTIAGQVWTEIASSAAFQLLSEKNQAGGYVGLEVDGFINPAFIKSIYASTSYVVTSLTDRNTLATLTGDIIVVTNTSETFVKLNNNPPVNVDGDFSLLSTGAAISSVNGDIGTVIVDFSSMIAQGGSQASFEAAVASAPSVAGNTSQIILNTNDILAIYALIAGLGAATEITIPLYINGTSYEDGQNVVYGAETERNLYRVKNGQGPTTGVLPTDITVWEQIGDFYTQQEVDNLLLTVVSNPLLNFNRPIHKLPQVGEIPGSNQLITGIEEIYYGRLDTTVELLSIDALEIGSLTAPTINGKITRNDADNISQITILDDTNTPVGNPVFVGTDAVIEFSFQVDTAIAITEASLLTYKIQVDTVYDILLPAETIISAASTIISIYPILYGSGGTDLDAATKYTDLQKLIEADGNKLLNLVSTSNKMYFCIPASYADRVHIHDDNGDALLGNLFPDPPVTEQVDSSGLNVDWVQNYKVYQSNYVTVNTGAEIHFIINPAILTGTETLDDIAEGIINKHLTTALREKIENFDGNDYLTKVVYDTDDNGIVEKAASRATNAKNDTLTTIPAQTFVNVTGASPAEEALLIELADSSNNKASSGYIEQAILPGEIGVIILEGFTGGYTLIGATIGDVLWLDAAGGASLLPPASGLLQTIGVVLDVAGSIINFAIGPQDKDDRANFLFGWRPFTPYLKDTHITVDLGDIPSIVSNAIISARIIVDGYTSTNDIIADFNAGKFEIIGGDMLSTVYDPNGVEKDVFDMDSMLDGITEIDPAIRKVTVTEDERTKLRGLEPSTFKGTFDTADNLRIAFSTSLDGDSATVTATGTTWLWDSGAPPNVSPPTTGGDWVDSTIAVGGDMKASTYDPAAKAAVIWDVDNHDDGVTNKVFTAVEKTKLTGIEDNAKDDQTAGEIEIAYESNANTNKFEDLEKTKLSGIEDNAKDDQSAVEVPYDPTGRAFITAIEVQGAVDELDSTLNSLPDSYLDKATYDTDDNGIADAAERIVIKALNDEAVPVTIGQVVYLNRETVDDKFFKLSANNDFDTLPISGFLLDDAAAGAEARIAVGGVFTVPTFIAAVANDNLYLTSTPGLVSVTPQTISNTLANVIPGRVLDVVAGNQIIEVRNKQHSTAADVTIDNTSSILTSDTVQAALVELSNLGSLRKNLQVVGTTVSPTKNANTYTVIPEMTIDITPESATNMIKVVFNGEFVGVDKEEATDIAVFLDGVELPAITRSITVRSARPMSIAVNFTGTLSVAPHTIDVRWKTALASLGSVAVDIRRHLYVEEWLQ